MLSPLPRLDRRSAQVGMTVCYIGKRDDRIGMWGDIFEIGAKTAVIAVRGMNGGHVGSPREPKPEHILCDLADLTEAPDF